MSLLNGSPLIMEDLDVTMHLVTYLEPIIIPLTAFHRILKNLDKRRIDYSLQIKKNAWPFLPKNVAHLKVGTRELMFEYRLI